MTRFTGRTALITGGTSGMGLATAHRLIAEGAHVVVTGRTRRRVDQAVAALGPRALGVAANAADLNEIDALMDTIRTRHDRLDVLLRQCRGGYLRAFRNGTWP
ncbi:SDR family NAD(P)-dependent oxidoreductase [Actinomadura miaoliensis]|uniref:SDR family NAD(P)-dependent oxidoreductase n=1 Tax=Actinomadura miaoliensis TaxID=430685 RepID=A0ABP7W051_9ACTN